MPCRDERTKASSKAGKHSTAGRMNVVYRDAKGGTTLATVIGPGGVSGLKLRIGNRAGTGAVRIIDNVAVGTVRTQTNVYFNRDRV